jgi:hypothetical protein
LEEISEFLANTDEITQEEIYSSITRSVLRSTAEQDNYDQRERKVLTMNELKSDFERNLHMNAVLRMRRYRLELKLREEDYYSLTDSTIAWNATAARRLDYICAVGNQLGLHAALSSRSVNTEYEFVLAPRPQTAFYGKYAQLGADQKESLLKLGQRPGEDIFLYMAPTEVLDPSFKDLPAPGFATGSTRLSTRNARIILAFIASCLAEMSDVTSVYCTNEYLVPLPPQKMSWHFTSAL